MLNLVFTLFLGTSFITWVYSYGFTDLNLTLSSNPLILRFITWTQQLAYFHRSLSLRFFILLILVLFLLYFFILIFARSQSRFPWRWLLLISLVFTLAYPFLSHDSFKYLFAAKMVFKYHLNPHLHSPNTIPNDPWLRFMRWVHTPSPYGPLFTLITLPAYLFGLGKFVPSLFLLKFFNLGWFLLAVFFIGQISRQLGYDPKTTLFNQLFFAFNPLILIEGLANVHNDIPMMSLFLLAVFLWLKKRFFPSFISLLASIAIKYIPLVFLPAYFIPRRYRHLVLPLTTSLFFLVPIAHYTQYQPWYIIWTITLVALLPWHSLKYLTLTYSLGGLARYLPFIATGLWQATRFQFNLLTFTLPVLHLIILLALKGKQVKQLAHQ